MKTVSQFFKEYEQRTNSHDFANVAPLINPKATYFFSEGTFTGRDSIRKAFEKTWRRVKNEVYRVSVVTILAEDKNIAVVTYRFSWKGKQDGKAVSGKGRGTNTLIRSKTGWQIIGEHLSV